MGATPSIDEEKITLSDYSEHAMKNWSNTKIKKRYGKLSSLYPLIQYELKAREVQNLVLDIICIKYWYGPDWYSQFAEERISSIASSECMLNHWQYDYFDGLTGEYLGSNLEMATAKKIAIQKKKEKEDAEMRKQEQERQRQEEEKREQERRRREEEKREQERRRREEEKREQQRLRREEEKREQVRIRREEEKREQERLRQEEEIREQERLRREEEQKVDDSSKLTTSNISDGEKSKVEAERLLSEAIKNYKEGRLFEAAGRIRASLDKYIKSSKKLNEAVSIRIIDNILEYYIKVIVSMLRNDAFDEAEGVLSNLEEYFPKHSEQFKVFKTAIQKKEWSPDYLRDMLKSEVVYREIIGSLN